VSLKNLRDARTSTPAPCFLRKDFIFASWQVWETRPVTPTASSSIVAGLTIAPSHSSLCRELGWIPLSPRFHTSQNSTAPSLPGRIPRRNSSILRR